MKALCPQFDFVLYAEPFPEADYTDPDVKAIGFAPRHCLTADDLLNIDGGRAAAWAAPRSELALRQKTRRAVMEAAEKTRRAVMEAAVPTTTKDALNCKVALNWGPTKVALSCATSTTSVSSSTSTSTSTYPVDRTRPLDLDLPPPPARCGVSVTHCITSTGARGADKHQKRAGAYGVCLPASICSGLGVSSVAIGGVHICCHAALICTLISTFFLIPA